MIRVVHSWGEMSAVSEMFDTEGSLVHDRYSINKAVKDKNQYNLRNFCLLLFIQMQQVVAAIITSALGSFIVVLRFLVCEVRIVVVPILVDFSG